MKRKLLILFGALVLVLSACGGNEGAEDASDQGDAEDMDVEEVTEDEEDLVEDPVEAGNKSNEVKEFMDEFGEIYEIKEWYSSDETDDDGINQIEFDGYKVNFSVALLEDMEGEQDIGFFVETENGTDTTVQYNMDMEIITDEQEQAETDDSYGIGESKPSVKTKGFVKTDLDYEAPESFEVTFEPPWDDDSEYDDEIGEEVEMKFSK